MSANIEFISAGAGSGKTYRMTGCLYDELKNGVLPERVIATTFTKKAANELVERVRQRLMAENEFDLAIGMGEALIGTVNSVCGQLLGRLAFAAGLPPVLDVIDEQPAALFFAQALEDAVDTEEVRVLNRLAARFGLDDWKKTLHALVNQARANTIAPEALPEQAEHSLGELLAFFPEPLERDLDAELQAVVAAALTEIAGNGDETKGTADYVSLLRDTLRKLERGELPWSDWVKLSKASATKRSDPEAAKVRDVALFYDRHPALTAEIGEWVRRVYGIAGRAMDSYRRFKQERGLIDFIDQEELLLRLLENPAVAASLQGEIDLLLVDEFQDTSPIQLALFVRLAGLAKKAVWVGDVKQAIYGFRGCDPALMSAVVKAMEQEGRPVETLGTSRRSRPQLVELANALFVPAFAGQLPAAQVKLTPHRTELLDDNALEFWHLEGKNKDLRAGALAAAVQRLFASGRRVVDRNSGQPRPLRFRDVALLCRTHKNAAQYVAAISALGLPVSLGRAGLLATPEARLALACLRRLVNAGDTLASAEIVALHGTLAPEQWLQDRLEFLANGGDSRRWRLEGDNPHPALVALEQLRPELPVLSPAEVLERALLLAEVEHAVVAWGLTEFAVSQRLTNLETLRALARRFEDACRRTRSAATVPGLLFWLEDLAEEELDEREQDNSADAIQVLTHHGAKGLEWPAVICADLDAAIRPGVWGVTALSETPVVDIAEPLAGRRLRYWPWPFGKQSAGISLNDRILNSPLGEEDLARQTQEARRLLYVSITRARDLLIMPFAANGKARPWLDCLGADWLRATDGELLLPDGHKIICRELRFDSEAAEPGETTPISFPWFPQRLTPSPKLPATVIPSSLEAVPASIGRVLRLGERLTLRGKPDMNTVGTAVHGLIGAVLCGGLAVDSLARATALLDRYGVSSYLDAAEILARAELLKTTLVTEYGATAFYPEWPVQGVLDNCQRFAGWIDLLVDTPEGWILIDHKSFPGRSEEWAGQALGYSGQLAAYRTAVEVATERLVRSSWINFWIGGGMVEVGLLEIGD